MMRRNRQVCLRRIWHAQGNTGEDLMKRPPPTNDSRVTSGKYSNNFNGNRQK